MHPVMYSLLPEKRGCCSCCSNQPWNLNPVVLRGMARDFPRITPSGFLGSCSSGTLSQTSGRLHSRGFADRRKQSLECGGGGNLLMGLGKSQKKITQLLHIPQQRQLLLSRSRSSGPRHHRRRQNFGALSLIQRSNSFTWKDAPPPKRGELLANLAL